MEREWPSLCHNQLKFRVLSTCWLKSKGSERIYIWFKIVKFFLCISCLWRFSVLYFFFFKLYKGCFTLTQESPYTFLLSGKLWESQYWNCNSNFIAQTQCLKYRGLQFQEKKWLSLIILLKICIVAHNKQHMGMLTRLEIWISFLLTMVFKCYFFFLPGGGWFCGRLCCDWFLYTDRGSFSPWSLHVNGN